MQDFKDFMSAVSREAGLQTLIPSDDGLLQLRAGDIEMGMQFIPASNKIFLYTEIGILPENAPVFLYRTLLSDQAVGYRTGGGSFALIKASSNLIYQLVWDFIPSEPGVFAQLLSDVLDFTEKWQKRLAAAMNGKEDIGLDGAQADSETSFQNFSGLFTIRV
ncbi:MAG: type III secretion system chaperone [Victivallales bacterium]|nr:type III secretion system chaperone [Victivallales bacterium]